MAVADSGPFFAHLNAPDTDPAGVRRIQAEFQRRNPGYEIEVHGAAAALQAALVPRVVFVQSNTARARAGDQDSEVGVGDVVLLRAGQSLSLDHEMLLVVFRTPVPFPGELPAFLRPDWDERITDVVGGCATEEGAYRRIVLTWLGKNGPYLYHALNAHRVRITDSFTHYHPPEGGFDEFYLVQMTKPGARLITSDRREQIERPQELGTDQAVGLLKEHSLAEGDLVYIPRGIVHRGLGGVLAHVITVPGFKPGAEIGVDHHLRAINERLALRSDEALPFHEPASHAPLIK